MEVSQRLKYVRKRKHVSIAHVSENIGVSKPTLISYEQGLSSPRLSTIQDLAEFYGVSLEWLMGFTEFEYGLQRAVYPYHLTDKQPGVILFDDLRLFCAPLVKEIRAENDLLNKDNIEDFFYVDITFAGLKLNDVAFLYRLNSNNMVPKYSSGDLLLIHKQDKIKDGEVAILIVNEELKVNLYHHSDHYTFLESINPEYKLEKIMSTLVKIIGRVIWRIGK